MGAAIVLVDDATVWVIVGVMFLILLGMALPNAGEQSPAGRRGSKILAAIAVALVVVFVVLIWMIVRSK